MKRLICVRTKYRPATNTKGAAIVAHEARTGYRFTFPFPYDKSGIDCYVAAFEAFQTHYGISLQLVGYVAQKSGYDFICEPNENIVGETNINIAQLMHVNTRWVPATKTKPAYVKAICSIPEYTFSFSVADLRGEALYAAVVDALQTRFSADWTLIKCVPEKLGYEFVYAANENIVATA